MNRLVAEDLIPAEAEEALYLFNDVRNRIVHGHRSSLYGRLGWENDCSVWGW
jgi:hypothetical protein